MEKQKLERLITSRCRLSFNALFRPEAFQGKGEVLYRATLLFDPKEEEQGAFLKTLAKKCKELARENFKSNAADAELPIKRGDDRAYEGYAGMVYLTAKSKFPPQLVGANPNVPLQEGDLYSGCYVRASVVPYPWRQTADRFGVSCYLGNIQKIADGDRLGGGGMSAAAEFDAVEGATKELAEDSQDEWGF